MVRKAGRRTKKGHSTARSLAYSAIAYVGFFAGAELLLRALWTPPVPLDTVVTSPDDPRGRELWVPTQSGGLGWAVLENLKNPVHQADPELIFHVRPNPGRGPVAGYQGVNSLGFRGEELELGPRRPGEQRILALGDSCTWGWGVKDFKQVWPIALARRIGEAHGIPSRAYDLGQPGFSSTQGLLLYRKWVERIDPDVVALYFGWNDSWGTPLLTDRQTMRVLQLTDQPWVRAVREMRVYQLLEYVATGGEKGRAGRQEGAPNQPQPHLRVPPEEMLENLEAIAGEARARRAKVVLILPPYPKEAASWVGLPDNEGVRRRFEGRVSIPALPAMRPEVDGGRAYFGADLYHPNEKGHAYIAEELAREIGPYRK